MDVDKNNSGHILQIEQEKMNAKTIRLQLKNREASNTSLTLMRISNLYRQQNHTHTRSVSAWALTHRMSKKSRTVYKLPSWSCIYKRQAVTMNVVHIRYPCTVTQCIK